MRLEEYQSAPPDRQYHLSDEIYDSVLQLITSFGRAMERLPITARQHDEPFIRDTVLFVLNANFQGFCRYVLASRLGAFDRKLPDVFTGGRKCVDIFSPYPYPPAVSSNEDAMLRRLLQALETVSRWEHVVTGSQAGGWQAAPGSELETDDKLAHPFGVSSASWSAITAAVSHLGVLRDSLYRTTNPTEIQARIHTHGQLTLVRGALENASLAYWLLQDDQQVERIVRRLQEDWGEVRQLENVRALVGSPAGATLADRERQMTQLLAGIGGDPARLKKRPSYGEIVMTVGECQPTGGKTAFVIWKACSSIAHGELRGLIAYLDHSPLGKPATGHQLSKVTGNVDLMCIGSMIAIGTTRETLRLYEKRSGTKIPM